MSPLYLVFPQWFYNQKKDKWYCSMNSYDPQRATCSAPEEKTSSDEVTVTSNLRNIRKKQKQQE